MPPYLGYTSTLREGRDEVIVDAPSYKGIWQLKGECICSGRKSIDYLQPPQMLESCTLYFGTAC